MDLNSLSPEERERLLQQINAIADKGLREDVDPIMVERYKNMMTAMAEFTLAQLNSQALFMMRSLLGKSEEEVITRIITGIFTAPNVPTDALKMTLRLLEERRKERPNE